MWLRRAAKMLFATVDRLYESPPGPRILIYHQVGVGLGRQMEVDTHVFRRQLGWLAANKEVVDLETAIELWEEPNSERFVVLTFDDGYEDTFTVAFPMLEERGMPFTLYLATQSIETGVPLGPAVGADPLTWEMVEHMQNSGLVTVGAHTHTHRDLRSASRSEIEHEVGVSNSLIQERTGSDPRHFAYPWGYHSIVAEGVIERVYSSAVLGGVPYVKQTPSAFQLHRYPIQRSDEFTFFRARVRGGLRSEERIRRKLRHYNGI